MARVTIRIPGLLDRFTDGQTELALEATTMGEAIDGLLDRHPALEPHLFTAQGAVRPHVRLLVNGELVAAERPVREAKPELQDGDTVVFLQAVSGG